MNLKVQILFLLSPAIRINKMSRNLSVISDRQLVYGILKSIYEKDVRGYGSTKIYLDVVKYIFPVTPDEKLGRC